MTMAMTSRTAHQKLKLPTLPAAVLELLKATRDESKSMAYLADLASHDPALAAQILRLANSPLMNPSKQVRSLSHAAIILGVSTIRNLAVTISICQAFSQLELPENFSLKDFWQHSITCAVISRIIARQIDFPAPEEAFLAGLLHDLGQLFLILAKPTDAHKIVQDPDTGQTIISSEQRIWGTDHAQEGARILSMWHIAPSIVDAVRFHHRPEEEIAEASDLVKIVYSANLFSHYFAGRCRCRLDGLTERIKRFWNWQPPDISSFREEIGGEMEEISTSLGISIEWHGASESPKVDLKDQRLKEEAHRVSTELALLTGTLEALLEAKSVDRLLEILFGAITLLSDFDRAMLFLYRKEALVCVAARGTADDSYAKGFKIKGIEGSIWQKALSSNRPLLSETWFQEHRKRIIDEQMENLLEGPFMVIPMAAYGNPAGILVAGIKGLDEQATEESCSLLRLLCSETAVLLKGLTYRQWWEKEHVINENIVRYSPAGIVLAAKSGETMFMNPSALSLLGLSQEEAFGLDLFSHLGIEAEKKEAVSRLIPGQSLDLGRVEKRLTNDQVRWLSVRISCVEIMGFERYIVLLNDETSTQMLEMERQQRQKLLEIELEKKRLELEKAQQRMLQAEKSGIATSMAKKIVHEASNPLNVIKNFLKILKLESETGKIKPETIDTITKEIDRVSRIIREFTDLSRTDLPAPEKGSMLKQVLDDLLPILEPVARDRKIKIELDIAEDLPGIALDQDRLKQLLINMIKNSMEALEEAGGGLIKINAREAEGGRVLIEIADTGPGVPDRLKSRIFDPFVTTKGEGSSGIGLSVCMGIVSAAGGEIRLEDKESFGAVFQIVLPAWAEGDLKGGR